MTTDDPYRSAPALVCPWCTGQFLASDTEWACERGCGSWFPVAALTELVDITKIGRADGLENVAWWKSSDQQIVCPVCRADTATRIVVEKRIHVCGAHGVLVSASARAMFDQVRDRMIVRERKLVELMALLADDGSSAMRIIADRIVRLEERVERLATELDELRAGR